MDRGAIPALPRPALVLHPSSSPEAYEKAVPVSRVFIEVPDIGAERLFYRGEPEHPGKRRVAGEYPAIRGCDEISGKVIFKKPPVAHLALLQGTLHGLQEGVLPPERLILDLDRGHTLVGRPLPHRRGLPPPLFRPRAGRSLCHIGTCRHVIKSRSALSLALTWIHPHGINTTSGR
ncbi:hypothetical protein DSECCO2_553700 [anaerobic digester metagenome]